MKIILATYNYLPFHWGGSEYYVAGLAKFLQASGHEVIVVAATSDEAFEQYETLLENEVLRFLTYSHEGIKVYGGQIKKSSLEESYAKNNPDWESHWKPFWQLIENEGFEADLIHLHAHTAFISESFVRSARQQWSAARLVFSYHTPASCPKDTLLHFGETACEIKPDPSVCTACVLQEKSGGQESILRPLGRLLPNLSWSALPAAFRLKHLISLQINGFQRFLQLMDQVMVFSDQIRQVLLKNELEVEKIWMDRHGIDERFRLESSQERSEEKINFVFLGRFTKVKGLHTLLNSWNELAPNPLRELRLVGGSQNPEPEIAAALKAVEHRKDVKLIGSVKPEEVREILCEAHCLIIPSEWVEIGPLVLHEAIACGANVITSDIGGCAELAYYYGDACTVFPMRNTEALKSKIENFKYRKPQRKVRYHKDHYEVVLDQYKLQIKESKKRRCETTVH